MRILMLNYEFPPIGGGAGKANLCLLKEFADNRKLSIDVLTCGTELESKVEEFASNINIYKVGIHKKNLHYWRKSEVIEWLFKARFCYRMLTDKNDYDLAHAFFGFPTGWLCLKTAKKIPYIISLRGSDVPGYNVRLGIDYKILAPVFRKIWKSASSVIANSTGLAQLANEFMPGLNIGVIPNGISTETFHHEAKRELAEPIKLLTACRLISRKRIDILIHAVKYALSLGVNLQLNIAGQGNLMNTLKSLTNKSGVADKVNFLGRVPAEEMPGVYRQNDIFIMSSAHEGMSNAMLEAMASGMPIITTPCEGVEELIADNGIVVKNSSPDSMANAIKLLATDKDKYDRMSTAATDRAANFSWEKTASEYMKIYHDIYR